MYVKALHYGLLSLSMLPIGIGQSFFSLFCLTKR
jgi:hypothetical protein